MARRGRSSIRSSGRTRRSPSPKVEEDEATVDIPDQDQSNLESPAGSQNQREGEDEEQPAEADTNAGEEEEEGEPLPQSPDHGEDASNPSTPRTTLPKRGRGRGRGRGRPATRRISVRSTPDMVGEDGSDNATPARRGRGRGRGGNWRGGTRGRGRGANRGPSHVTRVPIDKEGNMMDVIDDEIALPEDPEGETKVDKNGNLLGGREYRVRTFTLAGRGEKLYMLSTEPARCTGFRDSYLFFNKHLTLFKIIIDDDEKRDLIERELIPHSYKGRAIGVVTARSVFREFGCKIVVGGKKVTDDYLVSQARGRGDIEGELADPYDKIPEAGQTYNRNQYVAWHGASSVYHTQPPNTQVPGRAPFLNSKKRTTITSANWMHEHALAASTFNSALNMIRKNTTFDGVYDPHTNLMCYPAAMQPTHARWERVPTPPTPPLSKKRKLAAVNGNSIPIHSPRLEDDESATDQPGSLQNGVLTNGIAHEESSEDDEMDLSLPNQEDLESMDFPITPAHPKSTPLDNNKATPSQFLKKNYMIVDTHFSNPSSSLFALQPLLSDGSISGLDATITQPDANQRYSPAPEIISASAYMHHDFSAGRPAHLGIPRISEGEMEDVELPENCREAIREARKQEELWTNGWAGSEVADGARGPLRLGVGM